MTGFTHEGWKDYRMLKIIYTGEFGADMKVSLINDDPITIWIDSKNRK